jgi:hypothetical protein
MTGNSVDTSTPEMTGAAKRDAEYVKTLMATVGIATSLIGFCLLIAARLLMH